METSTPAPASLPDILASERFIPPFNTFLEYAGSALGIIGWLGVRQVGSPHAQMLGFLLWIAGGMTLVVWGYYTKSGGIMVINLVNTGMAASALAGCM